MGLITKNIGEGITLNYLETDKFKTGFLSVNFIAPLEKESAAKNAIIPNILMRGSGKYPNMAEINKQLDYLYASSMSTRNQKRGDTQIFGICASMIDSAYTFGGEDVLSSVADMLGDLLLNPITDGEAFDTAYTESEKKSLIDAINAKINNKAYYARTRLIAEMCKNERFGLPETGTVDEVAALCPKCVYEQYKYALAHYPIEIFFVGKCHIDKLAAKLGGLFADAPRSVVGIPETEIVSEVKELRRVTEDMPVNQGKLAMGYRTGVTISTSDYPAMMMFNEIFGGSASSKLFMNVREKLSLCYYCGSSPDNAKGLMIVSSGIEVKNREIAEKAIGEQLDAMKNGDFTDEDIQNAKLGLVNSYRELSDSARGLESWYLGRKLSNVSDSPEDAEKAVERVTKADIVSVASKLTLDTVYFLKGTLTGDVSEVQ